MCGCRKTGWAAQRGFTPARLGLGLLLGAVGVSPAAARVQQLPEASAVAASSGPAASSTPAAPVDAGTRPDAATPAPALPIGISPSAPPPVPPPPVPQLTEETAPPTAHASGKNKHAKAPRTKAPKVVLTDVLLESQNHSQGIARRYAQLLAGGRYDEARLMHEEEGGRRPDWPTVRAAAQTFADQHGAAKDVEQHLVTWTGSELLTFFFTAHYQDGSELPIRVAIDHGGHVAGAAIGSESVPAAKKRYDRYDHYRTRTPLTLPFYGTWTVSNASPNSGNGHYLNVNQRFAIDFYITEEAEAGKRKSHRERGRQNTDYFAFGQDVLAPADGTVIMVVDGIPDNQPGQVDIYYRLGNSVVLSLGNNEYAHLCHLHNGSMQVRVGDKVTRGQVVAKCGNSGNSTAPHLHFQLTDGPLISHSASLPAYFNIVPRDGGPAASVLLMSGDRPTQTAPKTAPQTAAATPAP